MATNLLEFTDKGIFCPQGNFYVDPWRPVPKAIITHAHSDHAKTGHQYYLSHHFTKPILKLRLGEDIFVESVEYGEVVYMNNVKVSLHPAGHIVGSAQVRIEYKGEVWVVSGDYKTEDDKLSTAFELVPCNVFITESTFGMPIYNWKPQEEIFKEVNEWWLKNQSLQKTSILFGYSLGKAQRIIHSLDASIGPIYVHGAIANVNDCLRPYIKLPETQLVNYSMKKDFSNGIVIAPPSAVNSPWIKKFFPFSTAVASGWMRLRGAKRRIAIDRGFPLSDHADWKGLNEVCKGTGAEKIYVTHGYKSSFSRWLTENGTKAYEVETLFEGEAVSEVNEEV